MHMHKFFLRLECNLPRLLFLGRIHASGSSCTTVSSACRAFAVHSQTLSLRMASAVSAKTAEQLKNCGKILQFLMAQKDAGKFTAQRAGSHASC